jgi:uncharacterized membrane protein
VSDRTPGGERQGHHVYGWIWRKLPGGMPGKLVGSTVLILVVVALLFLVVFPWVEPRVPWNDVTVN